MLRHSGDVESDALPSWAEYELFERMVLRSALAAVSSDAEACLLHRAVTGLADKIAAASAVAAVHALQAAQLQVQRDSIVHSVLHRHAVTKSLGGLLLRRLVAVLPTPSASLSLSSSIGDVGAASVDGRSSAADASLSCVDAPEDLDGFFS